MAALPEHARSLLVTAGLVLTDDDGVTVAHPGEESDPLLSPDTQREPSRPVEVHAVADVPDPWWVVATLADAQRRERGALFVPTGPRAATVADRIVEVLSTPTGVASEADDGARTFYTSPDRIHLDGGGLALADSRYPSFVWVEESPDEATTTVGECRSGSDRKRLALLDRESRTVAGDATDGGDRTVAVLDGVDALDCPRPDPAEFPFSYRREDGVFAVRTREGRLLGTFTTVRAMREAGFAPIPAPVIPEFEFPASPRFEWAVLDGETLWDATGQRRID